MTITTDYLTYLPKAGIRDKSIKESGISISKFDEWLGRKAVNKRVLIEFRDHVGSQDWSPNYKTLVLAHVKAMLRWAAERELVTLSSDDISRSLKKFRHDREAPVVLTRDQLEGLGTGCLRYPNTGRSVLALLFTGGRHHEILNLTGKDVHEHGVEVTANRAKNRVGRVVPWSVLGPRVRKLFDCLPFKWDADEWTAIRACANRTHMYIKSLRSTAATYWVSRGILPPRTCAALMGHTVAVAEQSYWGPPILDLDGDFVDEWFGMRLLVGQIVRQS